MTIKEILIILSDLGNEKRKQMYIWRNAIGTDSKHWKMRGQ